MLYVDDKLPRHPKIFRAGAMLGTNGPAQAIAMFLAGLGYAREHLTDGFLPDKFVASCGLVERPQAVAKALSSRAVKLWHRTRGGYQIHDYHDWNRKAADIKQKRAQKREQKAAERARQQAMSLGVSPGDNSIRRQGTSRARASTYHDPQVQLELVPLGSVPTYEKKDQPALARRDFHTLLKTANPEAVDAGIDDEAEAVREWDSAGGATAGPVSSAVRDREADPHGGPDDRRLRVEGADQRRAGGAGLSAAQSMADVDGRDGCGDESGREGVGTEAASPVEPATASTPRENSPGGSTLATVRPRPLRMELDSESARKPDDEPKALKQLRDVITRVRP